MVSFPVLQSKSIGMFIGIPFIFVAGLILQVNGLGPDFKPPPWLNVTLPLIIIFGLLAFMGVTLIVILNKLL